MSDETLFGRRDLLKLTGAAAAGAAVAGRSGEAAAATSAPGIVAGAAEPLPRVPRRRLGKTNREVPILLMGGAMRLDQRFDPKLAECMRFGVDYFDVADCYAGGTSETAVGNFLQRMKKRDQAWITTKSDEWEPEGLVRTLETSLRRLKSEHVELFYLHQLDDESKLNSTLARTVEQLKKEGRIKFFGFSCHSGNVVELLDKAAGLSWIDSIMFRYSFRSYGDKPLNQAIDRCAKADIGLIAMKTQSSEAGVADAWKKFEQTGKWNKFQAVLKAVWADARISAAVSHMDSFEKLKQNIAAACDKEKLGALDQHSLEQYAQATRTLACDGCDHLCNPAVDAPVRIGPTLRYVMYHDVYGEKAMAQQRFAELPAEAQRLSGIDFSPANRACPYGVDVAAHMARAGEIFTGAT
jgi:predicted aldo/keto reductase-like oxidoreductase